MIRRETWQSTPWRSVSVALLLAGAVGGAATVAGCSDAPAEASASEDERITTALEGSYGITASGQTLGHIALDRGAFTLSTLDGRETRQGSWRFDASTRTFTLTTATGAARWHASVVDARESSAGVSKPASASFGEPAGELLVEPSTCLVGEGSCTPDRFAAVTESEGALLARAGSFELVKGGAPLTNLPAGALCEEAALDACIRGGGGATCVDRHCAADSGDDVCASELAKNCLRSKGGLGCKKFCGHPVSCYKNKGAFSCSTGGCMCLDPGVAADSPLGNFLIEMVGTAGMSLAARLSTKVLRGTLALAAERASLSSVSSMSSSLDDAFGTAFGMGARAGLRLSAHPHELVDGAIRTAPGLVKVPLRSPRSISLPSLGAKSDNWIWLIDDAGNFIVAPEVRLSATQSIGHPTLCGGCAARIAGEILEEVGPDGARRLVINNQSGRYFQDFERGAEHLRRAGEVLRTITGRPVVAKYLDF